MKLLILDWGAYTSPDICAVLQKHHVNYKLLHYCFGDKAKDSFFTSRFTGYVREDTYDAVFTVNYYPLVAQICYENSIPYLSWSYDNPLNVNNIEETLGYPTNQVFLFDRIQAEGFLLKGFKNVYHLPLAVNMDRLSRIKPTGGDSQRFSADISFVGKLYASSFPDLSAPLDDYHKGYLDSLIQAQLLVYGYNFLEETLSDTLLAELNRQYREKLGTDGFQVTKELLSYSMATYVTHKERLLLLSLLSRHHSLNLYSREIHPMLSEVSYRGSAGYATDMPKIFKLSRINLNITLKAIQSGIPLRAMDILGCGGLLFSNYQPELCEHFIPGTDFVQYDSIPDAMEKAAFYLSHEELRRQIAAKGQVKVGESFDYSQQLSRLFQTAGLS